ncbi:O-antigen ligase family protein [Maribacter sp. IgM3_T14_3]|uniref:O-antigen ligase family protein n=1 Tax=Maribacter sp. IgM3_T14_3 TaxID=3415140 RepID=UPI003C6FD05A
MLLYVLALLTFLIFTVLFYRKPKVETYVLFVIYALPFLDLKIIPVYLGYLRVFDAITLVGFIFLFKEFIFFSRPLKYSGYFILGLLFFILSVISGLNAEFGFSNYFFYYPIITVFIFLRFLFISFENNFDHWKIINAFKTAYIFALFFMTLQFMFGLKFTLTPDIGVNVFNEDTGVTRYQGIFGDSQLNGQFLAMGSFMFLLFQQNISLQKKYLNYCGFTLGVVYLILAGSRSAVGGFLVGLLLLFLLSNLRVKVYGLVLGFIAIASLFLFAPDNAIFSRSGNLSNDLDFRQSIWEETIIIIENHPFLGVGLGNFQEFTSKYNQDLYLEIAPGEFLFFTQPENGYLKILAEHGIIAFALFSLFFIIPFLNVTKGIFFSSVNKKTYFLIAALCSWLVAFNTVYTLTDYRILLLIALILFFTIVVFSKEDRILNETL